MSDTISNRFELLSNELLLDIFEYLDAYQLCQAFYELNHRLDALLRSVHLYIRFDLWKKDKTVWTALTSFINPSKIDNLSYGYDSVQEKLLYLCKENLRSLSLYVMARTSTEKILQLIPVDNQIKCFYITEGWGCNKSNICSLIDFILFDHAHRFTSLVNLSLSFVELRTYLPNVSVVFSQLRRLSLNGCYWSLSLLRFLRENTPNLRSLQWYQHLFSSNELGEFVLPHIHEFHINYSFDVVSLQSILSIFPSLRRLRIDWIDTSWSVTVNGIQWQKLIEKYLPHLKQLTIDFDEGIDEEILKIFCIGEFLSKKKLNVKMIIDKIRSRCRLVKTICFGQQWSFDYFHSFEPQN